MVFRRPGTLLPIERQILEVAVRRGPEGMYGFALANELAGESRDRALVAHGTLYKALNRMRRAGLLTARWEDADVAAQAGRPRRRMYTVTAHGVTALQASESWSPTIRGAGEATT